MEVWKDEKIIKALNKESFAEQRAKEIIAKHKGVISLIILSKPENYLTVKNFFVRHLLEKYKVILVSLNSTYKSLVEEAELNEKDSQKPKYIDMFSQNKRIENNHVCLGSNTALSECNDYIDKFIEKEENNCVLFDSLTALLLYNEEKSVKKFLHYLSQKLLEKKVSLVILGVQETETENVCKTISQFIKNVENI